MGNPMELALQQLAQRGKDISVPLSGRTRSDDELMRILEDPQAPLDALTNDELRRLQRLIHPPEQPIAARPTTVQEAPIRPVTDTTPARTLDAAQGPQDASGAAPRDDQALLGVFYDRTADLSSLSEGEVRRLLDLLDPVPSAMHPIAEQPPNPSRPVATMDPNPQVGKLWWENQGDADAYLRELGVDPQQLSGVYRGMRQPLPGGYRVPPWGTQ